MRKHTQNKIIDAISFICMLMLLITGIIMYVALPPGSGEKVFLDLSRHEWGSVHFWMAVLFTLMIIIHLLLHYSWIVNSYNPLKKRKT